VLKMLGARQLVPHEPDTNAEPISEAAQEKGQKSQGLLAS